MYIYIHIYNLCDIILYVRCNKSIRFWKKILIKMLVIIKHFGGIHFNRIKVDFS